jgi:hypothetical protein
MRTKMKNNLSDKITLVLIALFLIVTTTVVTVLMVKPSNRSAVLNELDAEGIKIIMQAQSWANIEIENKRLDSIAPYKTLRFDKFGYLDGLNISGRVHSNKSGNFSIDVSENGSTFCLTARGADGLSLVWKDIGLSEIPEPK